MFHMILRIKSDYLPNCINLFIFIMKEQRVSCKVGNDMGYNAV
jgi:hypothetical protein